jgi:hypothetical protein
MPVSKEVVEQQLKNIGDFYQWFTKKEIKHLPKVLDEGEVINAITSGLHDGNTWLIVVTYKRVLFLDKGMIYGLKQIEIPIRQISAISHKIGLFMGIIEISSSGGKKIIENIRKRDVAQVAKIISGLIENNTKFTNHEVSTLTDIVSQLERLAALKEKGILTEKEFQSQKVKLLN